nr:MAG TPA: hypothetical protein [Bacteriophage sp.]DAY79653.1 MAG TPA: hypothetical protein [Caudoviricetes sp.]
MWLLNRIGNQAKVGEPDQTACHEITAYPSNGTT